MKFGWARCLALHLASEVLVIVQVTPLTGGQVAQANLADPHPFEAGDFEADQFAHAANLAFFAFAQHKAELILVLPAYYGALQRLAVEAQAKIEARQPFVAQFAFDANQIFLVDR